MIYLDYNATTPLAPDVLDEITTSLKDDWGNPSSTYKLGLNSKKKIEDAREKVATMIGGRSSEIIFTSGGTEANNMVIHTVLEHFSKCLKSLPGKTSNSVSSELPHIITSTIEHDSIALPLEYLRERNLIEVTEIPVSKVTGAVSVSDVVSALRPTTCLVTIMLANNETGVIQPIQEISSEAQKWVKQNKSILRCPIFLHTDAAQALGKIPVDVTDLGVDYLTIVGHKFYGPRIGALYVRDLGTSCPLHPQLFGGGQEKGYRSGTENTAMIVGLGKAAELVTDNLSKYSAHFSGIKSYFEKKLKDKMKDLVTFNNHFQDIQILPNTISVSFLNNALQEDATCYQSARH